MAKNITPFFATEMDLSKVFNTVMTVRSLQFVIAGLLDSATVKSFSSLLKPDPKVNYLIADQDLVIEVRDVPQRNGGHKFAVDQLINTKTIALRTGGMIDENCLVAGQVGTVSEDPTSLEIYKVVVSEMQKQFSLIKTYYVGEEACKLLETGTRLTANPKSPPTYDLTPPSPSLRR